LKGTYARPDLQVHHVLTDLAAPGEEPQDQFATPGCWRWSAADRVGKTAVPTRLSPPSRCVSTVRPLLPAYPQRHRQDRIHQAHRRPSRSHAEWIANQRELRWL